ncbi:PREDICTED: polyamine-modulated factor 1-like [Haliaeetus leucocephalus]|uniref:polyamine-modulated factor 1-like n=1 Tax=Haliaeetus leucocephalus TaxID=52644 RepID=UPI00053CD61D|nr:PREDICTED: polyamine-modulated factor 1-like [Haliaeetus leucocephalus]
MAAERSGPEEAAAGGEDGPSVQVTPGRAEVFATVVDTFLEKLVAAGSYQKFANCYRCFYKLQPEVTRSIYDQFISQLQTSVKDEIQEVKNEGNLELLFNSLDKMVEEAKNQEEPAWRPSGIPEEDIRSAMVPYLLKHRSYLRKILKEKEEENRKVAESVLAGRNRIGELQQLIQARKHAWQAISKEQRELIMTFKEPQ